MAFYRRLRKAFFARSAPENGWQSVFGGVFSRLQTPLEPRDRPEKRCFCTDFPRSQNANRTFPTF